MAETGGRKLGPGVLRRAALALAEHLQDGLPLDADSLGVILRTLGQDDPARALELLEADPESSDAAPLLALVYSPGPDTRRAMEPALAAMDAVPDEARSGGKPPASAQAPCMADETADEATDALPACAADRTKASARVPACDDICGLVNELVNELVCGLANGLTRIHVARRARLLLPDGLTLELSPRKEDLAGLVQRLRPGATAPKELRGVIARRFAQAGADEAALALDLAVLLRHSRLAWTPGQEFFLSTLLERAGAGDDLRALAAWAVGFLDLEAAFGRAEFSPAAALAARRQALLLQLRQAEAQEMALERGSFEVRMSQGQRLGHVHGPEVRAELALLDRACRLVLGRTLEEMPEVRALDLGRAQTVEELLRLMPGLEDDPPQPLLPK